VTGARPPRIGVVDYGMGNRRSVEKALEHVGARPLLTADHDALASADALVVPGVGAFPTGMANLRALGLDELLHRSAQRGTPILGICLGMQLLFDGSVEMASATGLGLIPGEVVPLDTHGLRLPHIGWNDVRFERASVLTAALPRDGRPFYHVHSYAARPADGSDVVATSEYGERFATIVERGAVFGVQFHPEKSSTDGLELLRTFVALA
jgi:glutamine amidotransferase